MADGSISRGLPCDFPFAEFLHHDPRPTFILDLQTKSADQDQLVPPLLLNTALRENETLYGLVTGQQLDGATIDTSGHKLFLKWMQDQDATAAEYPYTTFTWSRITLASRWSVFVARACQRHCVCAVPQSEPGTTPEVLSALSVVSYTSGNPAASDTIGDEHRPQSSQANLESNKSLNSLNRARTFFAGELHGCDIDHTAQYGETTSVTERAEESLNISEESNFASWSNIRVAKRNAEFLAKISAFNGIGVSITNQVGNILFANDAWYKICGLPYGPTDRATWMGIFGESEKPEILDLWKRVTVDQEMVQFQVPLKWRWTPPASAALDSGSKVFPVWISVWGYADVSADGETIGACYLVTDISQQKWTERVIEQQLTDAVERARVLEQLSKDLVATESRFRRVSDSMPHGIFMVNTSGHMLYANDAYCEIFPGAGDASVAEPWWNHVPEEELARGMEVWRRLREEHIKVSFEMSFLKFSTSQEGSTPTSERRYMTVSAYPEMDDQGEIKHITGCITDISYLKIAEQTQGARADDAEESKRQLEQFIDMTSHEIRNPLSAIIHSAEEILTSFRAHREGLPPAAVINAMETVETIIDCINHSTRIVDDILVVSKLKSGLLSITPVAVRLVEAVEQTLRMFDGELRAADVSNSFDVDNSFETLKTGWVCLDVSRVLQVLVNLITNAIKFTKQENVRQMHISLRASRERPTSNQEPSKVRYLTAQKQPSATFISSMGVEDKVVYVSFSVTDSGCGMSETEQKNLFQRFSQAGTRTHVKYGGTGLGLFISRQLCEMHGGQIGLESVPGKGSNFTFYVKASMCAAPETDDPKYSSVGLRFGSQSSRFSRSKAMFSGMASDGASTMFSEQTILLVEDNLVNQKVVAKMLRARGFTVLVANHGAEALDRIRHSALLSGAMTTAPPISVILLDVEMPVMDGLTCIRYIRQMEATGELRCHVPVIATTANAREEQIDQAKSAGMDDVVTKPFRIDKLLAVMAQLWQDYPT